VTHRPIFPQQTPIYSWFCRIVHPSLAYPVHSGLEVKLASGEACHLLPFWSPLSASFDRRLGSHKMALMFTHLGRPPNLSHSTGPLGKAQRQCMREGGKSNTFEEGSFEILRAQRWGKKSTQPGNLFVCLFIDYSIPYAILSIHSGPRLMVVAVVSSGSICALLGQPPLCLPGCDPRQRDFSARCPEAVSLVFTFACPFASCVPVVLVRKWGGAVHSGSRLPQPCGCDTYLSLCKAVFVWHFSRLPPLDISVGEGSLLA
jgi:hypothetical protein